MPRESHTRPWRGAVMAVVLAGLVVACTSNGATNTTGTQPPTTTSTTVAPTTTVPETTTTEHSHPTSDVDADIVAAALANAAFQDVAAAEEAGYGSTLEGLGCFQSAEAGGMGVHYLREDLLDAELDVRTPEALVYEMGPAGEIVGLIAHEYIVPVDAWTSSEPPSLFGIDLHQHPVLPLWVLHLWLWKDNPAGMFVDFNPTVRMCPEGVPVFGVDRP